MRNRRDSSGHIDSGRHGVAGPQADTLHDGRPLVCHQPGRRPPSAGPGGRDREPGLAFPELGGTLRDPWHPAAHFDVRGAGGGYAEYDCRACAGLDGVRDGRLEKAFLLSVRLFPDCGPECQCEDEHVLAGGDGELCLFHRVDPGVPVALSQADGGAGGGRPAACEPLDLAPGADGGLEQREHGPRQPGDGPGGCGLSGERKKAQA